MIAQWSDQPLFNEENSITAKSRRLQINLKIWHVDFSRVIDSENNDETNISRAGHLWPASENADLQQDVAVTRSRKGAVERSFLGELIKIGPEKITTTNSVGSSGLWSHSVLPSGERRRVYQRPADLNFSHLLNTQGFKRRCTAWCIIWLAHLHIGNRSTFIWAQGIFVGNILETPPTNAWMWSRTARLRWRTLPHDLNHIYSEMNRYSRSINPE